jgi:hypothetical protein
MGAVGAVQVLMPWLLWRRILWPQLPADTSILPILKVSERVLSSKQLPGRAGHSKKPSAWGEMHKEADASPATQRWAPRQLGANAMSISWEDHQVFLAFTSNSRMI